MTTSPWRHQLTNMVAMIVTAALIVSCLVNTVAADGHSDEVHDDAPAAPPPPVPAPAPRPAAAPAPRPAAISPPTIAPVPRPPAVATSTTAATPRPTAAPAPSPAPRRLVELPKLNRDQPPPPPPPTRTMTQMSDNNVVSEERSSVEYKTRLAGAPGGGEMLVPYAPTLPKKNKDGHKKRMFDNAEEAIHDIGYGYYAAKEAYERFKKMH